MTHHLIFKIFNVNNSVAWSVNAGLIQLRVRLKWEAIFIHVATNPCYPQVIHLLRSPIVYAIINLAVSIVSS